MPTIHRDHLPEYPGSLAELAAALSDLRYDTLAAFLAALTSKLTQDATKDAGRGRLKLAAALQAVAEHLAAASEDVARAWTICEPFMDAPPAGKDEG
jgi:hypothetical protein